MPDQQVSTETYKLWVNDDSTVLVRIWSTGQAELAIRSHSGATWGPPVSLVEEKV